VTQAHAQPLAAEYFDGSSARAHPVQLQFDGDELMIAGAGLARRVALRDVRWPERTRHGARVAHLRGGASLHCDDGAAWDAWLRAHGQRDSALVHAQQSWRWAGLAVLLLALLLAALYGWGLPWAARAAVAVLPASVDAAVGETALRTLDEELMRPSRLPPAQQQGLRDAFERAVAALPAETVPAHQIVFRHSRIGPNAFALPGGTMVMTDQLVELVDGDAAVLTGVLAHELGHLRQRHGLRLLVQVGALGAVSGVVLGDFSTLLAGVPVWLAQASYTRDAEREADAEAVRVLRAAGLSPLAMVKFFEAVAQRHGAAKEAERSWLGFAIASHPADAERIRFFRDAAASR